MTRRSSPRPSSMGRRAIHTAEEQDVHTGWRRVYVYLQRSGATSKAKRRTRRRERAITKRELRQRIEEDR